jgi:hypothetical protein
MSGKAIGYALFGVFALLGLDLGLSMAVNTLLLELPNSRAHEREGNSPLNNNLLTYNVV